MSRSRTQPILPIPKLPIWKKDGKLFFVDRADLECVIEAAAVPDGLVRMRMGHGYRYVSDALNGARLDCWAVSLLESGIRPATEDERRSYSQFWIEVPGV